MNGLNRRSHPPSKSPGQSQQDAQAAPTTQHRWRSGSGRARMLVIGKGVELMMRARATTRCTGLTIQIVRRESHVSSSFDSWRLSWPWSFFQGGILIVPTSFSSRRKQVEENQYNKLTTCQKGGNVPDVVPGDDGPGDGSSERKECPHNTF